MMVLLVFGIAAIGLAIASFLGTPWLMRHLREINQTILQTCPVSPGRLSRVGKKPVRRPVRPGENESLI